MILTRGLGLPASFFFLSRLPRCPSSVAAAAFSLAFGCFPGSEAALPGRMKSRRLLPLCLPSASGRERRSAQPLRPLLYLDPQGLRRQHLLHEGRREWVGDEEGEEERV